MMGGDMGGGSGPKEREIDRVELALNFVRNPQVAGQPLLRIKSYMRRSLGLSEDEVDEVLRKSGLQSALLPSLPGWVSRRL